MNNNIDHLLNLLPYIKIFETRTCSPFINCIVTTTSPERAKITSFLFQQSMDLLGKNALLALHNLNGFRYLTAIKLKEPFLSEEGLKVVLAKSSLLEELEISSIEINFNELTPIIASHCSQIKYLSLTCNKHLNDEGVLYLTTCSKLQALNFSQCVNISDNSLSQVVTKLKNCLKKLDISGCTQIFATTIKALTSCFELNDLNISECSHVTSNDVYDLLKNCSNLKSLILNELTLQVKEVFKDKGIIYPNLQKLSLIHHFLQKEDLSLIAHHLPGLESLDLRECYMNISTLQIALKSLKNLKYLFLSDGLSEQDLKSLERDSLEIFTY